jgi:TorA maturation chaperone TorD
LKQLQCADRSGNGQRIVRHGRAVQDWETGLSETRTSDTFVAAEDVLRARCYGLLAQLLRVPPTADFLDALGACQPDGTAIGGALAELGRTAMAIPSEAATDEYNELFIGLTRGELVPYASYYLTGFLYEKPLARLRGDMNRLGIARADASTEPEDHIASLCEMMAGLIVGAFGAPADLKTQRDFFDAHLAPWVGRLFEDLEAAQAARLYKRVGTLGRMFMEIESEAFAMAA